MSIIIMIPDEVETGFLRNNIIDFTFNTTIVEPITGVFLVDDNGRYIIDDNGRYIVPDDLN